MTQNRHSINTVFALIYWFKAGLFGWTCPSEHLKDRESKALYRQSCGTLYPQLPLSKRGTNSKIRFSDLLCNHHLPQCGAGGGLCAAARLPYHGSFVPADQ